MNTGNHFSKEEQHNQTLRFTIEYNEDNPIAVSEFTKALDALNQLYLSFVCHKAHSNEIYISEEDIKENNIGQFHIKEINKGSILCLLSGIGIISIIGLVGSIASIVSCAMYFWDRKQANSKVDDESINFKLTKNVTVSDLLLLEDLIQPIKEGKTITIEVEGEKTVIDYSQKQKIEELLHHIKTQYYKSYSSFRREWVQIERIKNSFYATILFNPLVQPKKLPVDIIHIEEILHYNLCENEVYYVDIKLNRSYHNNGKMKYVISHIYCSEPKNSVFRRQDNYWYRNLK